MTRGTTPTPTGFGAPPPTDRRGRLRAVLVLGGVAVFVLLLLIGLVIYIVGLWGDDDADAPPAAAPSSAPPAADGGVTEHELATRPMLQVPLSASTPHAMTTNTAGPPIALPGGESVVGTLVPQGFPDTPEGAVAQLAALTEVGLSGGDPQSYAQAYRDLAEPGAPPAEHSMLFRNMVGFRESAHLAPTGPKEGLRITWSPVSAQVKGTIGADYVVGCVLGEFAADYQGRVVTVGIGDCQALRRVDTDRGEQWRIASGPMAAQAPSPWPGTAEAVAAGYRDITR